MPFNGSGTFVPTVAGVTPGGTASSTELNGIIGDIVGGLTAAVAKSGESTMTGPLKTAVGSVGAPGIAMAGDPNTGWYWISADKWGFAVNGVLLLTLDSTGATVAGGLALAAAKTITIGGVRTDIPAGTKALFVQTAAPAGWVKQTGNDNRALRVVDGTASSFAGANFTTAFASQAVAGTISAEALSVEQMPAHTHLSVDAGTGANVYDGGGSYSFPGGGNVDIGATSTSSTGSGATHTHTLTGTAINLAVSYVDVIIATKS